jgi:hypothetical protein
VLKQGELVDEGNARAGEAVEQVFNHLRV